MPACWDGSVRKARTGPQGRKRPASPVKHTIFVPFPLLGRKGEREREREVASPLCWISPIRAPRGFWASSRMLGMPFGLAGKGLLEVEAVAEDLWRVIGHGRTGGSRSGAGVGEKEGFEPRSVLDRGRSPSPPTSLSTLSASLGGGGGGGGFADSAGLAAVSGNPPQGWLPRQDAAGSAMADAVVGGGLGTEGWWHVLAAVAAAAPLGPDQLLLRSVMGEIGDPLDASLAVGLKHEEPHQMLPEVALDFEAGDGGGGFGLIDPVFGCDASSGVGGGAPGSMAVLPPPASSVPVASAGEFSVMDGDKSDRVLPIPLSPVPLSPPPVVAFPEPAMVEMPHCFSSNLFLNSAFHQQQEDFLFPPHPKRHHPTSGHGCQIPRGVRFCDTGQDPLPWRQQLQCLESLQALPHHLQPSGGKEAAAAATQHRQLQQEEAAAAVLVDQLFKAAELVESGNLANAGVVLARLNHQLSPAGKPFVRAAFYCQEALQSIITNNSNNTPTSTSLPPQWNSPSTVLSTPVDVVLKLSAYKAFSEISPILQFTNFTCTQALLEGLAGCNHIHIIDFDIGVGGQWSSFMLELAQRRHSAAVATPSLKITALAPLSAHHSLELRLTRENLSHFAGDLNMPFEFNILNNDPLDLSSLHNMLRSDEAIAVNLPLSLAYPSMPNILCLVKRLSPKIVLSVDHGWDHNGLMFSHHFLHMLQSATILLDSIDAAGISTVVVSKIERYLLQPRIENAILRHHHGHAAVKGLPWQTLFTSAGFTAVPFSNFTETQAKCLLKRTQVRGFLLEKCQASLVLCWHHGVLVSVSAWKC